MSVSTLKTSLRAIDTRSCASPVTKRLRGRPWERKRKRVFERDQYLCQMCLPDRVTLAVEVDHVVPLFDGGSNDDSNLQSLCGECHQIKSDAEEKRRRG